MAITEILKLHETEQTGRDKRSVFISDGIVDLSPDVFRREALAFADLLRSNPPEDWRQIYTWGLESAVEGLDDRLVDDKLTDRARSLVLKFPSMLKKQLYSDLEFIIEDYGTSEADNFQVIQVPANRVTGHKVLPFPNAANNYHPKLNLRVQTSFDKPITVYAGPANIVEQPSPGRWVGLPLDMIEIATIL